jgi:phosphatidylglycerol---prolipoprotein diacylglyceryl transferase
LLCYPEIRLLPKLISIGSFYLPTYGVLVALAFLAGLTITVKLARRSGLNPELVTNLAVYCALAGLLGAKILMIAFDWRDFAAQPSQIFSLSTLQAAGVFQGGLVLAILTAFFYVRKQGLPWLQTADAFAPGVAIGHSIGRLGCFAAGCCWGKECTLPWAVKFHSVDAYALTGVPLEVPLHPSQLYELGTEAILFGFLYWMFGRAHAPGKIIGLYLVLSSAARFGIEFTRFHEQALPFGLPLSITQWIAIGVAGAGAALLLRIPPQAKVNPSFAT